MKYGRRARTFDPRIPKMSVVAKSLSLLPASVDYGTGMPASLGAMLNDSIGDCVEAAAGHSRQVWSFSASGTMVTPSDAQIEAFYGVAGGYVPGNPNTDNGTVIQVALTDWLTYAIDGNDLAAFVEIDQLNATAMRQSIYQSGLAYIGFNVPAFLQNLENPGAVWDVDPSADNSIIGGHCVILVGYNVAAGTFTVISWGSFYTMTEAFLTAFCDEAYMLADVAWLKATGKTPLGLTLAELEALMQALQPPVGPVSNRRRHRHHRRVKRRNSAG